MGLAAFLLFEHRTPICRWSNELGYLKLGNEHTFLSDCEAPEPVHPVVYSPVPPGQGLAEGDADETKVLTHEDVDFLFSAGHFYVS